MSERTYTKEAQKREESELDIDLDHDTVADRVEVYFLDALESFGVLAEDEAEEKGEKGEQAVVEHADYSGLVV